MKKLISYTMTALLASVAFSVASPNVAALEAKEKAAWQAFKGKDAAGFKKLLAPDMIAVYDSGIHGLSDELNDMSQMQMKSFHLSGFKVTMPDANTAVVAYVCTMKASVGTQDASGTYNCASVWQMKNGAWQAVFHTDVKAAGAMPRAQKKE